MMTMEPIKVFIGSKNNIKIDFSFCRGWYSVPLFHEGRKPVFRILIAAFWSRAIFKPQDLQWNVRSGRHVSQRGDPQNRIKA